MLYCCKDKLAGLKTPSQALSGLAWGRRKRPWKCAENRSCGMNVLGFKAYVTKGWEMFCLLFGDGKEGRGAGQNQRMDSGGRAVWDGELWRQRQSSCHSTLACCWPPELTPGSMFLLKVPLLLGLIALEPPVCSSKFEDVSKDSQLFAIGVEFAMFQFNQAQVDEYAYKLLWVGRSQRQVSGASMHLPPRLLPPPQASCLL